MQHCDSLLYDSEQSKQTTSLKTVNFIEHYSITACLYVKHGPLRVVYCSFEEWVLGERWQR